MTYLPTNNGGGGAKKVVLSQVVDALQLKEVRREVELSRRRSIKLKAQVDKLQESREGQGWSQHRERVKRSLSARRHSLAGWLAVCFFFDPCAPSVPGDGGSPVHSAAAEPSDGSRLPASRTPPRRREAAGCRSGPAAERGPAAGHQQH